MLLRVVGARSVGNPDGTGSKSARQVFGVNRSTVVALELAGNAFEVGEAILSEHAREVLRDAAEILTDYPDERILVEGHTDSTVPADYNMRLSRRRAASVVRYLVNEGGVSRERLVAEGFGETQPLVPDAKTEDELSQNRRVEFHIEEGDAGDASPDVGAQD